MHGVGYPLEELLLVDALVFCDMTTTPDGGRTITEERVAEILGRYGDDCAVGRYIRRGGAGDLRRRGASRGGSGGSA